MLLAIVMAYEGASLYSFVVRSDVLAGNSWCSWGGPQILISLPLPPQFWNDRSVSPNPVYAGTGDWASCMADKHFTRWAINIQTSQTIIKKKKIENSWEGREFDFHSYIIRFKYSATKTRNYAKRKVWHKVNKQTIHFEKDLMADTTC